MPSEIVQVPRVLIGNENKVMLRMAMISMFAAL